jgi:hypothetical protein
MRIQAAELVSPDAKLMPKLITMNGGAYEVSVQWDSETGVWVVECDDVPGLIAEAASLDELMQKLKSLIPELLKLNGAAA